MMARSPRVARLSIYGMLAPSCNIDGCSKKPALKMLRRSSRLREIKPTEEDSLMSPDKMPPLKNYHRPEHFSPLHLVESVFYAI